MARQVVGEALDRNAFRRVARESAVPRGPVDAGSERRSIAGGWAWFDPATTRRVAVWAFVMVLAFSDTCSCVGRRMGQTAWCACHVAAFEFFDGCQRG